MTRQLFQLLAVMALAITCAAQDVHVTPRVKKDTPSQKAEAQHPASDATVSDTFRVMAADAIDAVDSAREEMLSSEVVYKFEYGKARTAVKMLIRHAKTPDERQIGRTIFMFFYTLETCRISGPSRCDHEYEKQRRDEAMKAAGVSPLMSD